MDSVSWANYWIVNKTVVFVTTIMADGFVEYEQDCGCMTVAFAFKCGNR